MRDVCGRLSRPALSTAIDFEPLVEFEFVAKGAGPLFRFISSVKICKL